MRTMTGMWLTVEVRCQFCAAVWERRTPAAEGVGLRGPFQSEGWSMTKDGPQCPKHTYAILTPGPSLIVSV